jgi:hypothetical protein
LLFALLRLADNKTSELAGCDEELLPLELSALQAMDFDLALLGCLAIPMRTTMARFLRFAAITT